MIKKILFIFFISLPFLSFSQGGLMNFAADQLGINKNVVSGAEIIGGLYSIHNSTNHYQISVKNISLNVNTKDPQVLLDEYNRKIEDLNREVEEMKRKKKAEIDATIDQMAKAAAELAKAAGISTGNGLADLIIGAGVKAGAKAYAKGDAEKKMEEEKAKMQKELDNKLKSTMERIKDDITKDNTNAKEEYLRAAALCFSESDEKYYLENLKFHDCIITEIEKNYNWKNADWIRTSCNTPSKIKPFGSLRESNDYMACAWRKFQIYKDQFPHQAFFDAAKNFTESALAENPKNSEAYSFMAYMETDIIEKYKFISFAAYLNPGNNEIIKEKKLTGFFLTKEFFEAIKNDNTEFVKRVTAYKFHYGFLDKDKNNPIAAAVNYDKPEILQMILTSYKTPDLNDVFFYAVNKESTKCIGKLCELGVDVSTLSFDSKGLPLLYIAAEKDRGEMASLFLDQKVNIDLSLQYAELNNKKTELNTLLYFLMDKAIEKSNIDYYNKITPYTIDIYNDYRKNGETYFQYALRMNCKEIVHEFIDKGADINGKTKDGKTTLQLAINNNATEVALTLINKGFDLSVAPSTGGNYVNAATESALPAVLTALLYQQQSPNLADNYGRTPLVNCINRDDDASAEILMKNKANVEENGIFGNLFHLAIDNNATKIFDLLLSKGTPLNVINKLGNTPLMHALLKEKSDKAVLLINFNADLNIKNNSQWTPLNYAIYNNMNDIAKLLISKGANPNISGEYNWTPLHFATRNNNLDMVQMLLAANANKKTKDKWNRSPRKIAEQMNYDIIKSIL